MKNTANRCCIQAAEEKLQRKEQQKAKSANPAAVAQDNDESEGEDGDEGGIVASGKVISASSTRKKKDAAVAASASEADEVPLLFDPELTDLGSVLDKADVILHVLDARDPLSYRNSIVEGRADGTAKRNVLLLNKIGM